MGDSKEPLLTEKSTRRGSVNDLSDDSTGGFKSPQPRTMAIIPSSASMLNSVIGTGILALPIAFSRVGYGLGTIIMIVCMCLSWGTLVVIGLCVTETGATSYGTMMTLAVGKFWGRVTSVMVILHAFGVCIAYSLVIAQNLVDLLNDQGLITGPIFGGGFGDVIDNRRFWVIVPTLIAVIPLCMLPNYNKLRHASLGATSSMIYLSGLIAVYGIIAAARGQLPVWSAGRDACFINEFGGTCYEATPGVPCAVDCWLLEDQATCEAGGLGAWAAGECVVDNEPRACYRLNQAECSEDSSGGDPSRMDVGTEDSFGNVGPRGSRLTSPLLQPLICCVPPRDGGLICDADEAAGEICCSDVAGEPGGPDSDIVPWEKAKGWIFDDPADIFPAFSTFLFAFLTHSMAPQVVVELKRPSLMRITQMMGTTGTVSFFLYFFVGMMGYLMFGNCVCNNISVSFGPNPWIAVAQAFVVCSVTAGYPTNVWPCRDAILELVYPHTCGKHKKWTDDLLDENGDPPMPPLWLKRVTSVCIILAASTIAFFNPPFQDVLAIIGAVGGGMLAFFMPALAYTNIYRAHIQPPWKRVFTLPGILFCIATLFTIINTIFVFIRITDDTSSDVSRACLPPNIDVDDDFGAGLLGF